VILFSPASVSPKFAKQSHLSNCQNQLMSFSAKKITIPISKITPESVTKLPDLEINTLSVSIFNNAGGILYDGGDGCSIVPLPLLPTGPEPGVSYIPIIDATITANCSMLNKTNILREIPVFVPLALFYNFDDSNPPPLDADFDCKSSIPFLIISLCYHAKPSSSTPIRNKCAPITRLTSRNLILRRLPTS
jgi:hypothetical protein